MEIQASLKYARVGTQKARHVTDLVRGKPLALAMNVLKMSNQKSAPLVLAVLEQALASAEEKKVMDIDNLYVKTIYVNAGPHLRRFRPEARGRSSKRNKKQSHIYVVLGEK